MSDISPALREQLQRQYGKYCMGCITLINCPLHPTKPVHVPQPKIDSDDDEVSG